MFVCAHAYGGSVTFQWQLQPIGQRLELCYSAELRTLFCMNVSLHKICMYVFRYVSMSTYVCTCVSYVAMALDSPHVHTHTYAYEYVYVNGGCCCCCLRGDLFSLIVVLSQAFLWFGIVVVVSTLPTCKGISTLAHQSQREWAKNRRHQQQQRDFMTNVDVRKRNEDEKKKN